MHKNLENMKNIIRVCGFQSRHASKSRKKQHNVHLYFPDKCENLSNVISYCTCKSGMRTVGGCSHAISALYYIMLKQSQKPIPKYHVKATKFGSVIFDCTEHKRRAVKQLDYYKNIKIQNSNLSQSQKSENNEIIESSNECLSSLSSLPPSKRQRRE